MPEKFNQQVVSPLNFLLVQFDIRWENPSENLDELEKLIVKSHHNEHVVVLPETFSTGFSMNTQKLSEKMDGIAITWMKKMAAQMNCAICGSLYISENENCFNRFVWIFPDGQCQWYNKRHLFSMSGEQQVCARGLERVTIDYLGWKIFPLICYDLRFPVWSRNTNNYDILLYVANWPAARHKVWDILLNARAIENQCYVLGVNRVGTDGNGIAHNGGTVGIDPKGEVINTLIDKQQTLSLTLSYEALHSFRQKFNVLADGDDFRIA
jgi:omega-amidase